MIELSVQHQLGDLCIRADAVVNHAITALFGRSGCGKTSLINILAGLIRPDEGRIVVGDRVLFDSKNGVDLPPEQRRMGYVFQDARLFPHLDVRRNLTYGMNLQIPELRRHSLEEICELLMLGSLLDRQPSTLSGGEKQRVAIGRALLAGPAMMLMDEPLASLDNVHKNEIIPFIERLRDTIDLPIFYVSHSIDEVVRLADSMMVMSDGEIVVHDQVENVLARLDLRPLTGRYEAGAAIMTRVTSYDCTYKLTELTSAAGSLIVAGRIADIGTTVRIRIRARDVSLANTKPVDTSILNVFYGKVVEIENDGPEAQADVLVDVGVPLIARVTRRSIAELDIRAGKEIFVMVKAAAIDRPGNRVRRHN